MRGEMSEMIKNTPCKDCDRRTPAGLCHSTCKDYLDYRAELDASNKAIREQKASTADYNHFRYSMIEKSSGKWY